MWRLSLALLLTDYFNFAGKPFSAGTRACIGLPFAEAEGVALLASFILHYQVEVPANLRDQWKACKGETVRMRRERILNVRLIFLTKEPADTQHDVQIKSDGIVSPRGLQLTFRRRRLVSL